MPCMFRCTPFAQTSDPATMYAHVPSTTMELAIKEYGSRKLISLLNLVMKDDMHVPANFVVLLDKPHGAWLCTLEPNFNPLLHSNRRWMRECFGNAQRDPHRPRFHEQPITSLAPQSSIHLRGVSLSIFIGIIRVIEQDRTPKAFRHIYSASIYLFILISPSSQTD
ncbi:hypothetical protein BDP27DRAFT_317886 [Rhodocollybia butyracea]|uniref:Uncharacterized protein n=1 Tax=Rhodocollybia butyracea TaxID=206335 RepID=A0A9P5Q1Y0_9AGAR|nr:hypothetical protein BDP27DRAFT_317886 [Rhodocollybia butyracea]